MRWRRWVRNVSPLVADACRRSPSKWTADQISFYVMGREETSPSAMKYADYWTVRRSCRAAALERGYTPVESREAREKLMRWHFRSIRDFRDLAESLRRPGGVASGLPVALTSPERAAKRFLQRYLKGDGEWSRPLPPGAFNARLSDILRAHQQRGREIVGHGPVAMRDPGWSVLHRPWAAPRGTLNGEPYALPIFGVAPVILRRTIHSVDGGTRWPGTPDVGPFPYEGRFVPGCGGGRGLVGGKLTFLLLPGPIAKHFWYGPRGSLLRDSHLFLKFKVTSGGGLYHGAEVPWSLKSEYFRSLHDRVQKAMDSVAPRPDGRGLHHSAVCCTSCLLTGE